MTCGKRSLSGEMMRAATSLREGTAGLVGELTGFGVADERGEGPFGADGLAGLEGDGDVGLAAAFDHRDGGGLGEFELFALHHGGEAEEVLLLEGMEGRVVAAGAAHALAEEGLRDDLGLGGHRERRSAWLGPKPAGPPC